MESSGEFELLSITIDEEWFPNIPKGLVLLDLKNCNWGFSYSLDVQPYKRGFVKAVLTTCYTIQEIGKEGEDSICFLSLIDEFKVTDVSDEETKVQFLEMLIAISTGHHQAIFAVKNKDNFLADWLPSMFDNSTFKDPILKTIRDDWK
jgi:hypothetical protein